MNDNLHDNELTPSPVSIRIKSIRSELGLSQFEFGQKVGISKPLISMIESGKREPTQKTIRKISEKIGVTTNWLKFGTEPKFSDETTEFIANLQHKYHLTKTDERILEQYLSLPRDLKNVFIKILNTLTPDEISGNNSNENK